ncbi:9181_t:CDS:2 [Acaulospora colombiana]|uniref:9181_t:CDS:1 n=1 Tax=Acaulospora colombiana TaxID=27376 RepID=A0ACA9MJD5_9GLOM|nr:9181_t:CDS:2 [Acaulospora colombiana]
MASSSGWLIRPRNCSFELLTLHLAVGKLSREEFRRQKDLDAARKAGTAPAELDAEGRAINPHIPQYISQAPWYLSTGTPSLAHQRRPAEEKVEKDDINQWYARGQRAGPAATKYRKGACENCGAMTHKRAECMERPRKKGAKYTGKDIAPDEIIQEFEGGYDAKRDRWNGYDPNEHKKVLEEYAAIEAARQKLREEEIDNQTTTDLAAVKKLAKASQKLDTKTRITVRNLRIREDTAKYLINLDPESAYYDPKTRSMRDAPDKSAKFAGENFLRHTGDALAAQQLQVFAWQASEKGNDVDLHANPTAGEIYHQEYKQNKEQNKQTNQASILDKYGGEDYLKKAPKELLMGQTESYVEYSRTGQVVKGKERVKARSKYQEDWIEAVQAASHTMMLKMEKAKLDSQKKEEAVLTQSNTVKRLGEKDMQLDKEKLADAIREERKRKGRNDDETFRDDKRRKYDNGKMDVDVTEEDLEAYRRNRLAGAEDPMYNYKDSED